MAISVAAMTVKQMPSSSEPSHNSITDALTREITSLKRAVNLWNGWYVGLLAASVLVAGATVFAQYKTIRLARTLSDRQSSLDAEKDRQTRLESSARDVLIAQLKDSSSQAEAKLGSAEARIKEAEAQIAAAHAESQDATARAAEASAKAELFRLDIAKANERAAEVELTLNKQKERAAIAEKTLLELRERLEPRTITPELRAFLIKSLERAAVKGPFEITSVLGNAESEAYARQIEELVVAAGWPKTERGPIQSIFKEVPIGLHLVVHSSSERLPPHLESLGVALRPLGVSTGVGVDPIVTPGAVQIVVGIKPRHE